MTNEIATKEIEKPFAVIKQAGITNEQLFEKLLNLEKKLVSIEQKLNTPLIG